MNRIVCPKCRANNMPGQPRCFQCGSSLPPPEALQQAANPQQKFATSQQQAAYPPQNFTAAQQPFPQQPQQPFNGQFPAQPYQNHGRKNSNWRVYAIIAVVAVCCGLTSVFASKKVATYNRPASADAGAQVDELEKLRREHPGVGNPIAPPQDADADGTRKELDRLRNKYGIGTSNPHNPSDGSVPNGGAITFDQWRHQHPDNTNYQFR